MEEREKMVRQETEGIGRKMQEPWKESEER